MPLDDFNEYMQSGSEPNDPENPWKSTSKTDVPEEDDLYPTDAIPQISKGGFAYTHDPAFGIVGNLDLQRQATCALHGTAYCNCAWRGEDRF